MIYLALEEKRSEVSKHFKDMGANGEEPIFIFSGQVPSDALPQVTKSVEKENPVLLIIDPLIRFARVRDINDYAETVVKLEPLLMLSRTTDTHVVCLHHNTKAEAQVGDGLLGSTGLFASVDILINMRRQKEYRTIETRQRYGDDLPETVLHFDCDQRIVSIGQSKHDVDLESMKSTLTDYLTMTSEPLAEAAVMDDVEGRTALKRKALRELVKEGIVVRIGKGGKSDPYRYSCSHVPYIYTGTTKHDPNRACETLIDGKYSCSRNSAIPDEQRAQESENVLDLTADDVEIVL